MYTPMFTCYIWSSLKKIYYHQNHVPRKNIYSEKRGESREIPEEQYHLSYELNRTSYHIPNHLHNFSQQFLPFKTLIGTLCHPKFLKHFNKLSLWELKFSHHFSCSFPCTIALILGSLLYQLFDFYLLLIFFQVREKKSSFVSCLQLRQTFFFFIAVDRFSDQI